MFEQRNKKQSSFKTGYNLHKSAITKFARFACAMRHHLSPPKFDCLGSWCSSQFDLSMSPSVKGLISKRVFLSVPWSGWESARWQLKWEHHPPEWAPSPSENLSQSHLCGYSSTTILPEREYHRLVVAHGLLELLTSPQNFRE